MGCLKSILLFPLGIPLGLMLGPLGIAIAILIFILTAAR
jgi:hypothetical protein